MRRALPGLSYEALVRAALRDTSSSSRIPRQEVYDKIASVLPTHDRAVVKQHVDSALARMTKRTLRHWVRPDEFCLTFEEHERLKGRLAELELRDRDFNDRTQAALVIVAKSLGIDINDTLEELGTRVKIILDNFILDSGEAFASAVVSGNLRRLDMQSLRTTVISDINTAGDVGLRGRCVDLLTKTLEQIIYTHDPVTQSYLRQSADAYTLMAFLRAVPDVQRVVSKLFSTGWIWLDTSIILPAMAETLLDQDHQRFCSLLRIARSAGLQLRVTPGVVEEVERHFNRSLVCLRSREPWEGRVPFMLSVYAASGQPLSDFPHWVEHFAGNARPEQDIADYLDEVFGVAVETLEEDANGADASLRGAVQEVWHAAHERRRRQEVDPITMGRLIAHTTSRIM